MKSIITTTLLALLLFRPAFCALPVTTSTAVIDRESIELLHAWMTGAPVPATSTAPELDTLAGWRAYVQALAIVPAREREDALREVFRQTRSPELRMAILRTITENPEFQGRQALFIRRYGFYANWFNRLVFSAGQVVQGNIQSVAQLFVDGVYDVLGLSDTTPAERRAYEMLRRAQTEGGARVDPEQLAKLEADVQRALAQSDLDQAQYALTAGDPEAAAFYAEQAHFLQPDWTRAETLRRKATAEVASRRLGAKASSQMGYPDRTPRIEPTDPELLRQILIGSPPAPKQLAPGDQLPAAALRGLPQPAAGQAAAMRPWKELLRRDPRPDDYAHRWLSAVVYDPRANPDERLAQARSQRRSNIVKYIFIGPEKPREQAYKTASWFAQAMSAMQNVGIFYVFDVVARTGSALWAPPVPAEEVIDAQAAWLREAPDPRSAESRALAEDLYSAFLDQSRFDDARAVLKRAGLLDEKRTKKIDVAEAVGLLDQAQKMPAGPERQSAVKRIAALAPGSTTAQKAAKIAELEKKYAPVQTLTLSWSELSRWIGKPPPCGLPGERIWFDGKVANGEAIMNGVTFEHRQDEPSITLRYIVLQEGEERVHQAIMPIAKYPSAIQRWFEFSSGQRAEATQTIERLQHLPIPFALQGDAGLSGVDFYPKLLPIETKPGEIELYR